MKPFLLCLTLILKLKNNVELYTEGYDISTISAILFSIQEI